MAEIVYFGPAEKFGCELRPTAADADISHEFSQGVLTCRVPAAQLNRWANTDEVGFSEELSWGDGRTLRLLVEKDFACKDTSEESQADAYPNPSAAC
ncbi:MAG: hypothetical protein QM754_00995 [Tepidisphaeraceae bacterium]